MHFENILFIHLCQGTGFYVQIVRELNKKKNSKKRIVNTVRVT